MVKPIGPACNLACEYCFYLEKEKLYRQAADWAMPEHVLESFIRQYIESQDTPEVSFAWQGGEPTLLGIEFFRKAVELEKRFTNGKRVTNAFQTNGVLIDDAWACFLAENQFLVGLSLDGPKELHDRFRRDKGGRPTFDRVMRGAEHLAKHGAQFNILACVNRVTAAQPLEVYRFLKSIGTDFIQFIPIVERVAAAFGEDDLTLVSPEYDEAAQVTPWSVRPLQYGEFLSGVFDEWVRNDVGRVFVQIFDVALEAWLGMEPRLCVFQETCGAAMVLEHNGDLYSCDHFVYPENRLGNILEKPLVELVNSEQQRRFGDAKRDALPACCRECSVRFMCHGECPKHRFLTTPQGEPGLNYLCKGYKHFFAHIDEPMKFMAQELRAQRPPANVMQHVQTQDRLKASKDPLGPNAPCPCGSGKKYKKCCGQAK